MRRLLLPFVVILALSGPVQAQDTEIRGVIDAQIAAFLADDFATAFTYASPGIRTYFRTPETFGQMVREGYPMVWRPGDVRFLQLREIEGALWQMVQVTDQGGRVHVLDYRMIQVDGTWKIDAVQILPAPQVNA